MDGKAFVLSKKKRKKLVRYIWSFSGLTKERNGKIGWMGKKKKLTDLVLQTRSWGRERLKTFPEVKRTRKTGA